VSLWQELEATAGAIKHGVVVNLDEVRALLRRSQVAVEFCDQFRHAPEWLAYRAGDQGRLRVTIDCDDPVQWFADLNEATA
jgi:hypothetical protein